MEAAVHGGDHQTPGDWDEQVRKPALVAPRDQAHDDRTRHVRAGKRAAARAAARRHLMNEIEEEVAGERRAQARRQVVRAVHRQQDEEQVAPQQHGREHQQQLAEGRPPSADVPVHGHRWNDDHVGQVAEMQVLGQRHERQPFAQVQARLPGEQRRLPGRNRRGQPPVANDGREQLHFLVEERKQHQWMPVPNHAKDPRRRRRAVQDQQQPGERQVQGDQPDAAWNGIPEGRNQGGRDRQIRRRQRRRPARTIKAWHPAS